MANLAANHEPLTWLEKTAAPIAAAYANRLGVHVKDIAANLRTYQNVWTPMQLYGTPFLVGSILTSIIFIMFLFCKGTRYCRCLRSYNRYIRTDKQALAFRILAFPLLFIGVVTTSVILGQASSAVRRYEVVAVTNKVQIVKLLLRAEEKRIKNCLLNPNDTTPSDDTSMPNSSSMTPSDDTSMPTSSSMTISDDTSMPNSSSMTTSGSSVSPQPDDSRSASNDSALAPTLSPSDQAFLVEMALFRSEAECFLNYSIGNHDARLKRYRETVLSYASFITFMQTLILVIYYMVLLLIPALHLWPWVKSNIHTQTVRRFLMFDAYLTLALGALTFFFVALTIYYPLLLQCGLCRDVHNFLVLAQSGKGDDAAPLEEMLRLVTPMVYEWKRRMPCGETSFDLKRIFDTCQENGSYYKAFNFAPQNRSSDECDNCWHLFGVFRNYVEEYCANYVEPMGVLWIAVLAVQLLLFLQIAIAVLLTKAYGQKSRMFDYTYYKHWSKQRQVNNEFDGIFAYQRRASGPKKKPNKKWNNPVFKEIPLTNNQPHASAAFTQVNTIEQEVESDPNPDPEMESDVWASPSRCCVNMILPCIRFRSAIDLEYEKLKIPDGYDKAFLPRREPYPLNRNLGDILEVARFIEEDEESKMRGPGKSFVRTLVDFLLRRNNPKAYYKIPLSKRKKKSRRSSRLDSSSYDEVITSSGKSRTSPEVLDSFEDLALPRHWGRELLSDDDYESFDDITPPRRWGRDHLSPDILESPTLEDFAGSTIMSIARMSRVKVPVDKPIFASPGRRIPIEPSTSWLMPPR